MAPQYAPSLRSRLAPTLLLIQVVFIVIFSLYFEIDIQKKERDGNAFNSLYPEFQDVNVMVILGFGFLSTFLVRYGFSSSGFNLLVAAISVQWALILNGLESLYYRGKIKINLRSLVYAEMCTVPALISLGTVLGKTNPVHLIFIVLIEVSGFVLNEWLLHFIVKMQPMKSIMLLHIHGSFFGLVLTWILHRKGSEKKQFEKEKLSRNSGLFSMLGTMFLWMFWPSFNSILVDNYPHGRKFVAVCSTYLSLAVSVATAASVSVMTSPKGKLNLVQIQSSILAGGVAVGVAMPVVYRPYDAMTIGFLAAVLSTLGYKYLKSHMALVFHCHDTCSILSTHALPGLLGWLAQFLVLKDFDDHTMNDNRYQEHRY
ncbi:hypothetical protein WMY93_017450 [Mugilogobius chulae]|uniref:Ammonium transporter AmtB-like domain-containing protein n=1 Tax=Mugilogobius chulae TaxID=88201 RepID=A0AAW0NPE7_9GOBI